MWGLPHVSAVNFLAHLLKAVRHSALVTKHASQTIASNNIRLSISSTTTKQKIVKTETHLLVWFESTFATIFILGDRDRWTVEPIAQNSYSNRLLHGHLAVEPQQYRKIVLANAEIPSWKSWNPNDSPIREKPAQIPAMQHIHISYAFLCSVYRSCSRLYPLRTHSACRIHRFAFSPAHSFFLLSRNFLFLPQNKLCNPWTMSNDKMEIIVYLRHDIAGNNEPTLATFPNSKRSAKKCFIFLCISAAYLCKVTHKLSKTIQLQADFRDIYESLKNDVRSSNLLKPV